MIDFEKKDFMKSEKLILKILPMIWFIEKRD